MSLFDWGLYNTERKLADLKIADNAFTAKYFFSSAAYDWDADRLRLQIGFIGKGTEAECAENIKRAKGAFLNFTWDEKEYPRLAREVLGGLFTHQGGYKSKGQPADTGEQLMNITALEVTIFVPGEGGTYIPKAKCTSDFKSNVVHITRL